MIVMHKKRLHTLKNRRIVDVGHIFLRAGPLPDLRLTFDFETRRVLKDDPLSPDTEADTEHVAAEAILVRIRKHRVRYCSYCHA